MRSASSRKGICEPATKSAITIAILVIIFIIIMGIVLGVGFYLFVGSTGMGNNHASGFALISPKEYTVNIHGALQSSGYRAGTYGINVTSGLKSITEDIPLNSLTNNTIRANITQKDSFKIDAVDLTKTENSTYSSPYKEIDWLSYKDSIPLYKWKNIDKLKGIPDLYLTEGGVFTEDEMKPVTELYFINNTWDKDVELVFIKMSFPNGKMPFNSTYENNTIAVYSPELEQQKYKITSTYGIPENSKLILVTRDKGDGDENIKDSFTVKEPVSRLYISGNRGITLTY